jgi:hypothetical protein
MKTNKGFKLFEMDQSGNLYALFIDKNTIMPTHEWLKAGNYPTKGFAARPGYHIGQIPSAPWLMSADMTYKSQRRKHWRRVWAEVEYVADVDYTEEVLRLPKKCFVDKLPEGGFYKFRETGCNRIWIIADQMKITRMLSEEERMEVLNGMGYDEEVAAMPYMDAMQKRMKAV